LIGVKGRRARRVDPSSTRTREKTPRDPHHLHEADMNIETQEHLTTLRKLLTCRIHELGTELHALEMAQGGAALDGTSGDVTDRKDEAGELQRREIDAEGERVERAELRRCESALQRLDLGIYGDCCDCHEPIPLPRLLVQPDAQRCAACQTSFEHRVGNERARA
jgi:DnaK suppressor protein